MAKDTVIIGGGPCRSSTLTTASRRCWKISMTLNGAARGAGVTKSRWAMGSAVPPRRLGWGRPGLPMKVELGALDPHDEDAPLAGAEVQHWPGLILTVPYHHITTGQLRHFYALAAAHAVGALLPAGNKIVGHVSIAP